MKRLNIGAAHSCNVKYINTLVKTGLKLDILNYNSILRDVTVKLLIAKCGAASSHVALESLIGRR